MSINIPFRLRTVERIYGRTRFSLAKGLETILSNIWALLTKSLVASPDGWYVTPVETEKVIDDVSLIKKDGSFVLDETPDGDLNIAFSITQEIATPHKTPSND